MVNKKQVKEEIEGLSILQSLTKAYAQISSNRMKTIRETVLSSRDFLVAVDQIFQEVRRSYRRQVQALSRKKKTSQGEKLTFLAHNGKTVVVFLSANAGLYGQIVPQVFQSFLGELADPGVEVTIIGRLGRSLYLQKAGDRAYTYFDFPDFGTNKEQLAEIIGHLVQYQEIRVHYGRFQSIVRQQPEVLNISAESGLDLAKKRTPKALREKEESLHYLFEPDLEEILIFFETEAFASSFEQSMAESQLAKFASRMMAMDKAYENVSQELEARHLTKLKLDHYEANRKQLGRIASFRFWGGR